MTPLHAPDPMGTAAHKAALAVTRLDFRLLVAASPNATRAERANAARQALVQWPLICRAMAELEQAAPTIAAQARDEVGKIQDFIEGRAA